jgi:hypothetical protein
VEWNSDVGYNKHEWTTLVLVTVGSCIYRAVIYRHTRSIVKRLIKDPAVSEASKHYAHSPAARASFNKYVRSNPIPTEDTAFRQTGCRWQLITDVNKLAFYDITSKCFHKMHRRAPLNYEVICVNKTRNSNPEKIVSYLRKFAQDYGRVHFFGDSTSQQQASVLDCMFQAAGLQNVDGLQNKPARWISVKGQDTPGFLSSLSLLLHTQFEPDDVIVGNIGLHYQKNFSVIGETALVDHVSVLAQSMKSLSHSEISTTMNNSDFTSIKARHPPIFVWREGTPQNYPTANRWWPYYFSTCQHRCECTKLTSQMRDGNGTSIPFSPKINDNLVECSRPSKSIHNISTNLMTAHGFPIASVYDSLAAAPINLHGGRGMPFDCTHFGIDALILMNFAVLKEIMHSR